jgi:hypothetical protein
MRLGGLAGIVITLAWVLNLNAHVQAETKKLIYESGRQGVSWAVYLLNKKFVKEVELGGETRRLYLVELETDNSNSGVSRQTHLIQCSTSQPFVAFKDDSTSGVAIVHFINPGGETYGYNAGSHWEYWAVCHDVLQDSQRDLASQARQLGYSTELSSKQVEVPYALMQSLR